MTVGDRESAPAWLRQLRELQARRPLLADQIYRQLLSVLRQKKCISDAEIQERFYPILGFDPGCPSRVPNRPTPPKVRGEIDAFNALVADHATRLLDDEDLESIVAHGEQREAALELARLAENRRAPLNEVLEALREYGNLPEAGMLSPSEERGTRVALIRRLLSDQLEYLARAKDLVTIRDFAAVAENVLPTVEGMGKLGGKAAGLVLAACVLDRAREAGEPIGEVAIPRSYFLPSDGTNDFIQENELEEFISVKYGSLDDIRVAYPIIERVFGNSRFPETIRVALAGVLEEMGERPLIVRSSSLLEDRTGASFAGKYKSLFLPNQGEFEDRLEALLGAVAEVYASVFGPDPIQYRGERGLLDYQEEMGVIIQEVIGRKIGRYYMPLYAGVAFSRCEYRWSPRIQREDGMARLVVGLGTRAVDRVGDDYPTLAVLSQPRLRHNVRLDEVAYYSQRTVDVIDLDAGEFTSIPFIDLLRECSREIPSLHQIVSIMSETHVSAPVGLLLDFDPRDLCITFEGLLSRSDFAARMKRMMEILEEALGFPVDIEFAYDGERLYLVQCRGQSESDFLERVEIPVVEDSKKLFSANQFVSNGLVRDVEYLVYVDPDDYEALSSYEELVEVGRCIGKLNAVLPERSFVLMGPGRWGSRGDIRLGVRVTYADINRCAMLLEVSRKKGEYSPEVSFGTHFFQDLVESRIAYLPLYPDNQGVVFERDFFRESANHLTEVLPDMEELATVVRVLHLPSLSDGQKLQIYMDGENDEALAFLG